MIREKFGKYPHRVLESEIRNEAPRDDEAGLTGSLAAEAGAPQWGGLIPVDTIFASASIS
jgi:hypothetical protein